MAARSAITRTSFSSVFAGELSSNSFARLVWAGFTVRTGTARAWSQYARGSQ
jgi:hypothetical protein